MSAPAAPDLGGEIVQRDIPGIGLLRFENYEPGQWLTKKGELAKKSKRRYELNGDELPSVSDITRALSKDALISWAEDRGVRGGVQAERMGELVAVHPDDWRRRVRALGIGMDAARDEGSDRGKAIHTAMHLLATTGKAPDPSEHPGVWRAWLQGAVRAWLAMDPSAVIESEEICCHPGLGYAGRPDLIARVESATTLVDWKTSARGRIYRQAHFQTRLYAMAKAAEGLEIERILIVAIDDEGGFEIRDCAVSEADATALVQVWRACRGLA